VSVRAGRRPSCPVGHALGDGAHGDLPRRGCSCAEPFRGCPSSPTDRTTAPTACVSSDRVRSASPTARALRAPEPRATRLGLSVRVLRPPRSATTSTGRPTWSSSTKTRSGPGRGSLGPEGPRLGVFPLRNERLARRPPFGGVLHDARPAYEVGRLLAALRAEPLRGCPLRGAALGRLARRARFLHALRAGARCFGALRAEPASLLPLRRSRLLFFGGLRAGAPASGAPSLAGSPLLRSFRPDPAHGLPCRKPLERPFWPAALCCLFAGARLFAAFWPGPFFCGYATGAPP